MKRICTLLAALCLSLCMAIPAAAYNGISVYDPGSILEEAEAAALELQANDVAELYGCGVYVFIVEDFTDYGYTDIFEFAQDYYDEDLLGYGADRDGILLTLNTETRDVSLAVYGDFALTVFTDYAQELVWDAFLDDLGNDDWYGGCTHYLSACEELLQEAQNNDVPPSSPTHYDPIARPDHTEQVSFGRVLAKALLTSLLPAAVIAFVACGVMKRKMKTARKASGAAAYVSGAVELKVKSDHYTHSTTVRTPIKTDNGPKGGGPRLGGGGPHHGGSHHHASTNSRGFSGGSRKF